MKKIIAIIGVLFMLQSTGLMAQGVALKGKVTDTKGEALPFASVYVKGTTTGTTANVDGEYRLDFPKKGTYIIVFQSIGYIPKTDTFNLSQVMTERDIQLADQSYELTEFTVSANGEDPAYRVIREAIRRREDYKNQVKTFACDVYIKGNQRLKKSPSKFMGQEIGSLGGRLDSTGKGIVYLSESLSKYWKQRPSAYKEEMKYSKVSGNDNGFSFNSAKAMDISFYDNQIDLNRPLTSPIADGAMLFYEYRMIGTYYDAAGNMVNHIEVKPKRSSDPVFRGTIDIIENKWSIYSTNLYVLSEASKIEFIDSVCIKQLFVPITNDVAMPFNQRISFEGGIFGFGFRGDFSAIYTNYELNPSLPKNFFGNEEMKVLDGANKTADSLWQLIRPVPLTQEENLDYVKKDSLQKIWTSPAYLDSVDREDNKFNLSDLLFGYSHENSLKRRSWSIGSPLFSLQFNTVQGYNLSMPISFSHELNKERTRSWNFVIRPEYGFSDNKLRLGASYEYAFNQTHFTKLKLSGAWRKAQQFDDSNPITAMSNSIVTLLYGNNYMRLYDKSFGRVDFQHEIVNGLFIKTGLEYADKHSVENTTGHSWNKNPDYGMNNPFRIINGPGDDVPFQMGYSMLAYNLDLRLRFKQKYATYPHKKIIEGTKYPEIWLHSRFVSTLTGNWTGTNFARLSAELRYDWGMGLVGRSEIMAEAGGFIKSVNTTLTTDIFPEFQHFHGNQTIFAKNGAYLTTFQLLPYYDYSTANNFAQAHWEHHFNGFIFNKIPLWRKLNFTEVVAAHTLHTWNASNNVTSHTEFNFGIDNIGWGIMRLIRVDYVFGFDWNSGGTFNPVSGGRVGLKFDLGE